MALNLERLNINNIILYLISLLHKCTTHTPRTYISGVNTINQNNALILAGSDWPIIDVCDRTVGPSLNNKNVL